MGTGKLSVKGSPGSSLGFVGQMVSIVTNQLRGWSTNAALENKYVNGCGCI